MRDGHPRRTKRSALVLEPTQAIAQVGGREVDLRTDRVHWTAGTYRIHGTTTAQFQPTAENAIRFYASESRPLITQAVENAIPLGTPLDFKLTLDTARHRRIRIHTTGRAEHLDDRAVKVFVRFRAVTDERAAEAERGRHGARLRQPAHRHPRQRHLRPRRGPGARRHTPGPHRVGRPPHRRSLPPDAGLGRPRQLWHRKRGCGQLVRDTARLLHVSISKKARLVETLAPDLRPVEAAPSQLRRLVLKLVSNASEALSAATGEIRVITRPGRPPTAPGAVLDSFDLPAGDCACLEIATTGQGMMPPTLARVVDPFLATQLAGHGGASPPYSASCAPSAAPSLSKAPPRSVRPSGSISPSPPARRRARPAPHRQNPFDRRRRTRRAGHWRCPAPAHRFPNRPAAERHEALQRFRASPQGIAAVLPDLTIPGRDGAEVLRVIRALHPDVRVFVKSGWGEPGLFARLSGRREVPVLRKPSARQILLARLADLIDWDPPGVPRCANRLATRAVF